MGAASIPVKGAAVTSVLPAMTLVGGEAVGISGRRGSKVTLADVARRAGVSSTTASFVLSGRDMGISPATADRGVEAARALGYDHATAVAANGSSACRSSPSSPTRSPRTTTAAR